MSKLIVNQIQASGGVPLTLPAADGANGAFLVTDGSAQLDFQTIDVATNANVTAAVGAETTNRTAADALKANQSTTYTKTEVDTADALKANQATTYTKTEVDANIAAIPGTDLSAYDTSVQVDTKIAGIVDSAPETLNTLNELALALGDDANHVTTMTTLVGTKADQATTYTKTEVDNGFLDVAAPVLGGNLDGAGYTYTNLHPAVDVSSITGTHALDFTIPVHSLAMTGSTTFSISNCATGRVIIVGFSHTASQVPSFPTEVKWAGDEEPTWADHTLWLVSMTCFDTSIIGASATGFTV
jgi:hypothetical protein